MERLLGLLTLGTGFSVLARLSGPRIWLVFALGLVIELIGLYTGFPFGHLQYTGAWWPSVGLSSGHRLPLQMPFVWTLVVTGSALACWRRPYWIAGLVAAVMDLPIEPVYAGKLGYWKWAGSGLMPGGAPLLNFVGWFAVATFAAWILGSERERSSEPAAVLAGFLALLIASAIGAG